MDPKHQKSGVGLERLGGILQFGNKKENRQGRWIYVCRICLDVYVEFLEDIIYMCVYMYDIYVTVCFRCFAVWFVFACFLTSCYDVLVVAQPDWYVLWSVEFFATWSLLQFGHVDDFRTGKQTDSHPDDVIQTSPVLKEVSHIFCFQTFLCREKIYGYLSQIPVDPLSIAGARSVPVFLVIIDGWCILYTLILLKIPQTFSSVVWIHTPWYKYMAVPSPTKR